MATKKISIVIPFKQFDENSDELKLSLRSIERNAKFPHQIILLGSGPSWLDATKLRVIEFEPEKRNEFPKAFNVIDKLKNVIKEENIEDEILMTYDDIIFMNPVNKKDIQEMLALKMLPESEDFKTDASNVWKDVLINTMRALKRNKLPSFNFETHLPRLFDKEKLAFIFQHFGFSKRPYCLPTIYYNYYAGKKKIRRLDEDPKNTKVGLYKDGDFKKFLDEIPKCLFLNWSENQWNEQLKEYLYAIFPEKSSFEI